MVDANWVPKWKPYGQRAYEAYVTVAGGKSLISGAVLPEWDDLDDEIKKAWAAAATAVLSGEMP